MKKFIYFSAPWCGPCRQLGPIMDEVATQVEVQKVNVDNNPELSQHYGIRNVPTVVLTEDGNEIGRKLGLNPKQAYLNMYGSNV
jgi:thioredoxin 1